MGLSPADLTRADALEELNDALDQLEAAIRIEGPAPRVHREVMARHRAEWPTLWAAIDRLRAADHVTHVG
jgi:hypothetical protein